MSSNSSTFNLTASTNMSGMSTENTQTLYKFIGISLAIASGVFIGSSFVFKKKGLLDSTNKLGGVAGEHHDYLKSSMWWTGMILMIIGELCNFVAYAFTQAILVTPLGALSVVLSAVLSSFFLKERLNFQGKVGCAQCIIGATIIVLHAPENKAAEAGINHFQTLATAPGFLVYMSLAIVISLVLIFYMGPRYGKKSMLVYITVCSLIGSLSVVCTQGLGTAIVYSAAVKNQFDQPFLYVLLAFVVVTLLTEINYLNKALNLFNTSLVTPIYYVIFTSFTIVSSAVLFQGFNASVTDIVTIVAGFLVICSGILLLQTSKVEEGMAVMDSRMSMLDASPSGEHPPACTIDSGPGEPFPAPFGNIRRFSRDMHTSPNPYKGRDSPTSHQMVNRRSKTIAMGEERWQQRQSRFQDDGSPRQEHKIATRSFAGEDIEEEKRYGMDDDLNSSPTELPTIITTTVATTPSTLRQPSLPSPDPNVRFTLNPLGTIAFSSTPVPHGQQSHGLYGGSTSSAPGAHAGIGLEAPSPDSAHPHAATSVTNLLARHATPPVTPVISDETHMQRRAQAAGHVGVVSQYKMGLKRDEDGDTRQLRLHATPETGSSGDEDDFDGESARDSAGSTQPGYSVGRAAVGGPGMF